MPHDNIQRTVLVLHRKKISYKVVQSESTDVEIPCNLYKEKIMTYTIFTPVGDYRIWARNPEDAKQRLFRQTLGRVEKRDMILVRCCR